MREEARKKYQQRLRVDVDIHHKIAYRFEKAYRLRKKVKERGRYFNMEIVECI